MTTGVSRRRRCKNSNLEMYYLQQITDRTDMSATVARFSLRRPPQEVGLVPDGRLGCALLLQCTPAAGPESKRMRAGHLLVLSSLPGRGGNCRRRSADSPCNSCI